MTPGTTGPEANRQGLENNTRLEVILLNLLSLTLKEKYYQYSDANAKTTKENQARMEKRQVKLDFFFLFQYVL